MSNTSTFALGLGSGLALWYATKPGAPSVANAPAPTPPSTPSAPAPRNCAVHIDRTGITADGVRVELDEAVRRCAAAEGVTLTAQPDAPAARCAAMMSALESASITPATARNARCKPRKRAFDTFTVVVYPEGIGGSHKHVRWFLAETPLTWEAARDRLIVAGVIDPTAIGPSMPGYWGLTTEPRVFDHSRAEPFPDARPRGAARSTRFTREGRRILRDGEAIFYVDRVDLGDQRYAVSPHDADQLTDRMVRLLNASGGR